MTTTSRPAMTSSEVGGANRTRWLSWVSVLLLIVGVVAGVFLGRVTKADTAPPPDLASTSVTTMLTDFAKAVNAGDAAAIATFYAPNATMTDPSSGGGVATGNTTIAKDLVSMWNLGFRVDNSGTAIQRGNVVSQASSWGGGSGVIVYELGTDGKIVSQWIFATK